MGARHVAGALLPVAFFIPMMACSAVNVATLIADNEQGHYDHAVKAGYLVLAQSPDDAEAHFQLGLAYSHLDSVSEAYRHFARACELTPGNDVRRASAERVIDHNVERYLSAGRAEIACGSFAGAARDFARATKADPRRGDAWYLLGVAYARLATAADGFRDDAARAFRNAIARSDAAAPWYGDAVARARELDPGGERSSLRR